MSFLRKKSMAERAQGLARRVDTKGLARSGAKVVGSVASLTAASAIVSAVRKKGQN